MSNKTKRFSSALGNAPVLSGTAGALTDLLDAVGVTGWGSVTATSVSVTGGVGTANYSSGHPFQKGIVAQIAGATPAGLNGEHRVLSVGANTITFDATGVVNGAATGTITTKIAPAGWTIAFTATNKRAYRLNAVDGSGFYLRVDDTGTTTARVRAYTSMSDIDTGTGPFPTTVQQSGDGLYWNKSSTASGAARDWTIYADHCGFHFCPVHLPGYNSNAYWFGDVLPVRSGDPYACLIRGNFASRVNQSPGGSGDELSYSDPTQAIAGGYLARAANAVGGSVAAYTSLAMFGGGAGSLIGGAGMPYPNAADNGLILCDVLITNGLGLRGKVPGIVGTPQNIVSAFNTGDQIAGSGDYAGETLEVVRTGQAGGALLFKTLSDWR